MNGFQNPFLNPYGYVPQYQQMQPVQQTPVVQQQVTRVNGENGAKAYNIGANSSALLLDESGTMVWLVTSDGAGYRTVSAYDIVPHQQTPAQDFGNIENRLQTVEKKIEEMMNNGNTRNTSATRKGKSDDGTD